MQNVNSKGQNVRLLRLFTAYFLLFTFLCTPALAFEFDTSVDDEIRKNYNPSKIDDDMALPALPKILKENMDHKEVKTVSPTLPAQSASAPANSKVLPRAKIKVARQVKTAAKNPQVSYIMLKKGTKINVKSLTPISDRTKKGTKLTFISQYPVSTTYFTIPMGTIFKGELVDSHKPQLTANGGLIKIKINSAKLNNEVQPLVANVTKANSKMIFFNNIKGKRKYISSVIRSTKPGRHFCNKMLSVTVNLAQDGSSIIVAPFSLLFGTLAFAGNVVASPVLGMFYKGGSIYIPENSSFDIKLSQDVFIYN